MVTLTLDTTPHIPGIPSDLVSAFSDNPEASVFFESLAPSYKRNFVSWIESAKAADTRARRVSSIVEKLRAGEKR